MKFSGEERKILRDICLFAKKRKPKLYLVGGALRDLLLGRSKRNPDFDFCLKKGSLSFGKALAAEIRAGFVVLDEEHRACRLVKKTENGIYTLDFTDFRGADLEQDLLNRDFTINSIAVRLEDAAGNSELAGFLIDPCGGREDLRKKIIRSASAAAFIQDPLRILRAFSFSAMLGLRIAPAALRSAGKYKKKLSGVSFERIRDELFKIFDTPSASTCLDKLNSLKIFEIIFPETRRMRGIGKGAYHHLDAFDHTLETVRQLDLLLKNVKDRQLKGYLDEFISTGRTRRALLKLGAIMHDVGKPAALRHRDGKVIFHGHERIGLDMVQDLCRKMRLSNDETNALRKMVLWHLRPGYLADNRVLTARAKFRYFRDTASEAAGILLLSIADQRATRGPLTTKASRARHERVCFALVREYFRKKNEKKAPRLINGDLLMKAFKLEPSPLIGKVLAEVEELQAIGEVKTTQEALRAAEGIIKAADRPVRS